MALISFLLISIVLFVLGAAVGSFLNVVIIRSFLEEDWVKGRSRCDHCRSELVWYDMVPLFSYWWLGGACRWCKEPISLSHPVVEVLTGALFVWWYWFGFLFFKLAEQPFTVLQPLFWLAVGLILLVIFFADLWYFLIPDVAVVTLTVLAVLYRGSLVFYGVMHPADLTRMVVVVFAAVGFLYGLWLLTKKKGIGFGDVKLMMPLGLLLGWPETIVSLFLAFVAGGVVGLALLLLGRKKLKQPVPFGPFLIGSAVACLFWGEQIFAWYWRLVTGG